MARFHVPGWHTAHLAANGTDSLNLLPKCAQRLYAHAAQAAQQFLQDGIAAQ
jgi:hypothetical protein